MMRWLVEHLQPDGTWRQVTEGLPEQLTAEQARGYARTLSWMRNGFYRERFGR